MIVNMHNAKTHLSQLAQRFLEGEEVIIARNGTPLFMFAPVPKKTREERPTGFFGCQIDMSHFDDPIEGMAEYE